MIIMMLGLALALNAFTTYAITNQMRVLSDLNIPVSQGITRVYAIHQMQQHSIDDMITYQKISSKVNYEISKSQFESYNQERGYEVKKIKDLVDTFLNYGLDYETTRNLSILSTNLNEL